MSEERDLSFVAKHLSVAVEIRFRCVFYVCRLCQTGIIAVSSVVAKTSAFRRRVVFAGWKQRRVRACEMCKRGCAHLICVMMMPAYGRGGMCKDSVGSRCGNRLAYRRFWLRALCGRNIIVAREEGAIVSACIITTLTFHLCEAG